MKQIETFKIDQKGILIYQIAATYIGTVVGAGFATGQEIVLFFTRFGIFGSVGTIMSTFLFILIGYKTMILARRHECYSYQEFHLLLFGKTIGAILNLALPFLLLGGSGVMLSGMGALFTEQFHLPGQVGILLTILLVILIILGGMKGILWLNSLFVPFILILIFFLSLKLFEPASVNHALHPSQPVKSLFHGDWFFYAFLYVGLNLIFAEAVLVPIGKEIKEKSLLFRGSLLGGSGLGILLFIMHHLMLKYLVVMQEAEIPLGAILEHLVPHLIPLYSFIVMLEILTTLVGNIYGILRQVESISSLPRLPTLILLLLSAYLISRFGFRTLVGTFYPFIGAFGILYLLRILFYRPKPPQKTFRNDHIPLTYRK